MRAIGQLLPGRPVTGLDIGCGTGRYTRLLRALLPDGSLLAAADVSAAMLAQLKAARRGHAGGVVPLLAAAEQLPLRTASLDLVTAFNCVHHFGLARFLAAAVRVLRPGGQLFIYTCTPQQNARTIWARYFPGFTEHEQRLHSQAALRDAVRRTDGLTLVATQTFQHPRTSTAERLGAQAQGRHYSTFSFYTPQELRAAIATFLARLPGPEVYWVDEHLLVIAGASRHSQAEPGGPGQPAEPGDQGSGPPDQRRSGSPEASRRPRADHPVIRPADCWRRASAQRPDRRECARSPRPHVSLSVTAGGVRTHRAAGTAPAGSTATFTGVRPPAGTPAYPMIPGWRPPPGPGSPGVRRHPAGSPAILEPGPRARRHPGAPRPGSRSPPCAVILDQLHRQGDGPRAAGTTDGDASAPRQSRKTLSAAVADIRPRHGDV